jgi:branched-chain amino acid transport system permease protein
LGAIFVVCVLAFRRGIVGELIAFMDRRKEAKDPRKDYEPSK